jgi:hypothetical protein
LNVLIVKMKLKIRQHNLTGIQAALQVSLSLKRTVPS